MFYLSLYFLPTDANTARRERTRKASLPLGGIPTISGELDAIALRDETVRLKQFLNSVIAERDLAKAGLVKSQALVAKKDKTIQDLLEAGHISVSNLAVYW